MIELTTKGHALMMRAAEAGHVTQRIQVDAALNNVTCTCGRLNEKNVRTGDVINVMHLHFNREAGG